MPFENVFIGKISQTYNLLFKLTAKTCKFQLVDKDKNEMIPLIIEASISSNISPLWHA